jgi:NhaC family Na+:H+ antiporter
MTDSVDAVPSSPSSSPKMQPNPSLGLSLLPILVLILFLTFNVLVFGDNATSGANQIALLIAAAVAGLGAWYLRLSWSEVMEGITNSINSALPAVLILLFIGSLAGTWMLSGIVPALIYYGLEVLSPKIFLLASVVVCAVVSVATGSSWSTVATLGIALLGIGKILGIEEGIVAGAIISGAYFGDKMSPLSDTTNLAPAMAGTDLFTHIRYMAWTTTPSILLTLLIFLLLGLNIESSATPTEIAAIQNAIAAKFNITGWLFLVPLVVVVLIVRKVPALPALLLGTTLGGLAAVLFQPEIVREVAAAQEWALYIGVMKAIYGDISLTTDHATVNELLSTGGMKGMLNTIWLILCAMIFGGVMEATGMLERISRAVIALAHSTGSMIAATVGTCVVFNLTASDQYLAVVVPGKMYAEAFRKKGLAPENLSRSLEDSGTVTSVLIPWNTCGATQAGVLKVEVLAFAPYCFFNIISPFMSILFGYANIKIKKL